MTTRPAAQCDQCKAVTMLEPERMVGNVPPGWFVIHGPVSGIPEVADTRHDFCSAQCMYAWASQHPDLPHGDTEFWKSVSDGVNEARSKSGPQWLLTNEPT